MYKVYIKLKCKMIVAIINTAPWKQPTYLTKVSTVLGFGRLRQIKHARSCASMTQLKIIYKFAE